jgi:hypothetical protein
MPKYVLPKVTFYIDRNNRNKKGLAPIKANITIEGKKQTKIMSHVLPSDWNPNQQRVKPARPGKDNGHDEINKSLEKLQNDFKTFAMKCKNNRIDITPDMSKKFLAGENVHSGNEKPFWIAYDEYLAVKNISPKTLQNYTLYYTKLKEFEQEKEYYIDYHTINPVFFDLYRNYILKEKELGWNTFATAIKKLKFFMNWSLKKDYHDQVGYMKFSATEKEPTIIFLTMDELSTLYHKDFGSKRLNQVRDKFCFGCLTGLAFADLDTLTHEHINNGTLTKFRVKTGNLIDVELSDPALKIIERYKDKYKALPKISHQRFNDYIKEICQIVEINTPTIYKDFAKGIITEKIAPKHELVGSHTARKTFISNFYHNTKDINLTKKNAGITQDKTLRRYMGIDKQMEKEAMKKAFGKL